MPLVERQPVLADQALHPNPLLDRVYRNRGVRDMSEVDYRLTRLLPPSGMMGMGKASALISDAITSGKRILVIGDFDCDGATATSVAVRGLRMLGATDVRFLVPDRMKHGYGLTPSIVEVARRDSPDLIITVDNGISSFDGAKAVREVMPSSKLVITDHHLPSPDGIPEADAVVNPNQQGCSFASKAIAGCGVMFYVLLGVRQHLREAGRWESREVEPALGRLLDIVALGTVADLVTLDYNNRVLVSAGLKQIREGLACPGINSLLKQGKRDPITVVASDLGFAVAPRINAAGRLEDMTLGIRCLIEDDSNHAASLAGELDRINAKRREIEAEMVDEAAALLPEEALSAGAEADAYCLYREDWHEGVVGLVASRMRERVARPVICLTDTDETRARRELGRAPDAANEEVKGSARSIAGIHLKHTLDEISKEHPGLLTKFGGHAMAAGLTLRKSRVKEFAEAFEQKVSAQMTSELREGAVRVDCLSTPASWVTLDNARQIEESGPWGQGFEPPTFAAEIEVASYDLLQEKHLKMRVRIPESDEEFEAIAFNAAGSLDILTSGTVRMVFTLDINRWRGSERLQLWVEQISEPQEPALSMTQGKRQVDEPIVEAPHKAIDKKHPAGIPMTDPEATLF